jgi:hypothetical protein
VGAVTFGEFLHCNDKKKFSMNSTKAFLGKNIQKSPDLERR